MWRGLRTHGRGVYTHVERFPGWPHGNRTQWSCFRWAQGQKSDVGIPPRLCVPPVALSLLRCSAPYGSSIQGSFIETILPTASPLPSRHRDRSGVIHYFHGLHWFWPSVWLQVPFALDEQSRCILSRLAFQSARRLYRRCQGDFREEEEPLVAWNRLLSRWTDTCKFVIIAGKYNWHSYVSIENCELNWLEKEGVLIETETSCRFHSL